MGVLRDWARRNFRRIVAALCILSILGGIGLLWVKPWISEIYHWRRAQSALAHGDFLPAREHLRECLKNRPNDAATYFALAQTCRRAGDLGGFQSNLQAAERLGWSIDAVQLERDLTQAQCGALRPVEAKLVASLESAHPEEGLIFEALVKGYLESYRLRDVVRCATRWKEREPRNWQPFYYCGRAFQLHKLNDLAIEQFRTALSLKAGEPQTSSSLAAVLTLKGEYREAMDLFQARWQAEPTNTGAMLGVAYCQRRLGEQEAALATLDRLLAQDGNHAGGMFLQGQLTLDLGNPKEAISWLLHAQELTPKDPEVLFALSRCLRLLGRTDESLSCQREWDRVQAEWKRLEDIRKEIARQPANVALRHDAGKILQGLGRYAEAVRWYQSILQIDPAQRPTHEALANCFEKIGDPERVVYHRKLAASATDQDRTPR
jgi:tetratricopeptide (TPR) repeat protein